MQLPLMVRQLYIIISCIPELKIRFERNPFVIHRNSLGNSRAVLIDMAYIYRTSVEAQHFIQLVFQFIGLFYQLDKGLRRLCGGHHNRSRGSCGSSSRCCSGQNGRRSRSRLPYVHIQLCIRCRAHIAVIEPDNISAHLHTVKAVHIKAYAVTSEIVRHAYLPGLFLDSGTVAVYLGI